jgi:hypothetical protein
VPPTKPSEPSKPTSCEDEGRSIDGFVGFDGGQSDQNCLEVNDYLAVFYERAAIAEYDGGLSREDAESEALDETLRTYEQVGIKEQVRCVDCQHFIPDPPGCGGIGECEVRGEGTKSRVLPLYPNPLRHCRDFVARFETAETTRAFDGTKGNT